VYAADDENPSQFTFYREGTPTPSEHTLDQLSIRGHAQHIQEKKEKRKSRRSVFLASIGFPAVVESPRGAGPSRPSGEEHEADLGYVDGESQQSDRRRRICGLPVGVFWGINIAVILLIIGLSVGLGLGLSKGGGDGETTPYATPSPTTPSPTTSSPLPTAVFPSGGPPTQTTPPSTRN
jgi:hypothetical protein